MKRVGTPSRSTSKQQYKTSMMPINQLISTLLTTTSSQLYSYDSNRNQGLSTPQRININGSKLQASKQMDNTQRPQTSRTYGKNNQEIVLTISPEKRSIRPKSSTMAVKYKVGMQYESTPKQLNIENCKTKYESRNYSSVSKKQELKVQYKLVTADNPFCKIPTKPPKSIQSTKPIGLVRGYGVNSHKYHNNSEVCEGRILIIANLTKTTKLQAITSLYAFFQSNRSVLFLDFIREQFQIQITKKLQGFPLPPITKQLIESCLHKIENKFCQIYNVPIKKNPALMFNITNSYGLSYSIVFVRGDEIIICTKGVCHVKTSTNFGNKMQGQHSQSLHLRRMNREEASSLDFIALISEGVQCYRRDLQYQSDNDNEHTELKKFHVPESAWVQRQLWQVMLTGIMNKNEVKPTNELKTPLTIHELLGNSIDSMFAMMSNSRTCRNMSIVLICFRNLQSMLAADEELELPYCKQSSDRHMATCENEKDFVESI